MTARSRHAWRIAAVAVLAVAFAFVAGFATFVSAIQKADVSLTAAGADAVVVLTGGAGRVVEGIDLLAAGRAKKLFVSGVDRGVDVAALLAAARRGPAGIECCIALGYGADDTAGNAAETARWMDAEGFASLLLVTTDWHMPRSLIEFRRAMPKATIVPRPVPSPTVHVDDLWRWPGSTQLLAGEYIKVLAALSRVRLAPLPAAAPGERS
ncbi:MAG: YdcF family protein [Alphaproteobacteria bacterium]|nr:YdcF family protein [Alphaproteobacteria bacterium]